MFIVIEGIDGCGKTTQVELLAKHMWSKVFRFPNDDSPTGKLIRSHLEKKWAAREIAGHLAKKIPEIDALMFQSLQFTNRLERAVELNDYVGTNTQHALSDRYHASAVVYGGADGLDVDYLINTQKWLPQPDLNILLDIPIECSLKRRPERRDRYEENIDFLRDVMGRYLGLWARMMGEDGDRWVILNGDRPKEEVHADIVGTVVSHANRAR